MRVLELERRGFFAPKMPTLHASLSCQTMRAVLRTGKIPFRKVTIDGEAIEAAIREFILADTLRWIAGTAG